MFSCGRIKLKSIDQKFTEWFMSITNANCYGGTDNFFQLIICVLVDAGFNTCNGWRISSSSHIFSKLLPVQPDPGYESQTYVLWIAARITRPGARVIDIWIKLALKFVSLERKRIGWTQKILLSHEKLEKRTKIFFPDEILSRHSLQIITAECLRKHECLFCQNLEATEAGHRVLWRL